MEERCVTKHIYIWMFFNEFAETLHGIGMCLWLTDIKSDLMFYIFPVVGHGIVHMYRIPHDIGEEAYGIFMKCSCLDRDSLGGFLIAPAVSWNDSAGCTVNDFPPAGDIISCIWGEHVRVKSFHDRDRQCFRVCHVEWSHEIHLLNLIRVGFCPCVIFSGCIVGGINLCVRIFQCCRKISSVTVTDGICAPEFH